MYLERDGKHILCDGENCTARACVPVVRGLAAQSDACVQAVRGWLFVLNTAEPRHYCPRCSAQVLTRRRAPQESG